MVTEVALPDVQRVFLDREWPDYDLPEHVEQKFPEADGFVSWHCFRVAAELDEKVLRAALRALLARHDALRIRLVKRDGRWLQRFAPAGDGSLELAATEQEAFDTGLRSLSLTSGPILHCAYVRRREGGVLFLFYHHVLVDWISAQVLAEDLETALTQARAGADIRLPPATTTIGEWTERVESAVRSGGWAPELRRLTTYKNSWPPVPFTPFPADGTQTAPAAAEVRVSLDPEPTTALLRPAGEVRFLDLLQTAIARALAPWAGMSALPMCVVVHGRDHVFPGVDLSRTVGSFAMGLLDVVDPRCEPRFSPLADPRLRFAQVLLNFSRSLEMAYEADGRDGYVSIYDRYNPQVSLNFVGRVEASPPSGLLRVSTDDDWRDTRIRAVSRSLDCVVAIDRGRLVVTWKFSPRFYRPATIEALARSLLDELTRWC